MPQISKVRIVNFRYNDGNRLIADELFDFAGKENDTAKNVLLNLANGGGKSVLVQLMMQPVIPKAKVAGRKIESFFGKATDHCFVVLEWIKDDSPEKLMTGIAMSATESAVAEDDASRGMSIKYYTFYSNYRDYQGLYNILNLPLSKGEKGRFVPAAFDDVRNLAKKSGERLQYYVSDDNPQWQRKLLEYNINPGEWRLTEELNSEEGGLSKYFGDFKTSDAVVDKLFIKRIEDSTCQTGREEDSTLSTMMVNFAKNYSKQRDIVRERDALREFSVELTNRHAEAEALWNHNDRVGQALKSLFSYADAMDREIQACRKEEVRLTGARDESELAVRRIEYEKASYDYFEASDAFSRALEALETVRQEEGATAGRLEEVKEMILLLECADYHHKLIDVESGIAALRAAITEREQDESEGQQLAILKYSAHVAIEKALAETEKNVRQTADELSSAQTEAQTAAREKQKAEQTAQNSKTAYDTESGKLESAYAETDKALDKIGFAIGRRLDGRYGEDEITALKAERDKEAEICRSKIEQISYRIRELQAEKDAIPQQIADLGIEKQRLKAEADRSFAAIQEYDQIEETVLSVCSQYNLDPEGRFDGQILAFLKNETQKAQAKVSSLVYKITIAEESVTAAERASIHVPGAVITYLNQTCVRYKTCEQYLLEQVESGTMTADRCAEILKKYPAVAFGVMIEDSEKQRFFDYGREEWLPAMVPLFSPVQMANVLKINEDRQVAIAFYSEEYFADRKHYLEKKEEQLASLRDEQSRYSEKQNELTTQTEGVRKFVYPATWKASELRKCDDLNGKIAQYESQITATKTRTAELEEMIRISMEEHQQLTQQESAYDRFCLDFTDFQERVITENKLSESVCSLRDRYEEADRVMNAARQSDEKAKQALADITDKKHSLDELYGTLEKSRAEVADCAETQCVDGEWDQLLKQYRELQDNQSRDLASLRDRCSEKENRAAGYRSELKRRNCPAEKYVGLTYSYADYQAKQDYKKVLEGQLKEIGDRKYRVTEEKGKAEGIRITAEKKLKEYAEEPLEKGQIGSDFDSRIRSEKKKRKEYDTSLQKQYGKRQQFEKVAGRVSDVLSNEKRSDNVALILLEEDYEGQYKRLRAIWDQKKKELAEAHGNAGQTFEAMRSRFRNAFAGADRAVNGLCQLLTDGSVCGDRYFSLMEQIEANQKTVELHLSKIETDLAEFDRRREDLVHQCVLQGQRIYDGLRQIMSSSRVKVYQEKATQQMLKLDIPEEVDPIIAHSAIESEIRQGTEELSAKIRANGDLTDAELRKEAQKIIGSRTLFRKYIGRDSVSLRAYKIDRNPENAGYRRWEDTQVKNSGAEKFVVYFAIILSLMNYSRSGNGGINDRALMSTLVLDNPFGPISSAHVLEPMFAIANHFRVQMICLSDISKQDILNCFDLVIKALVKRRAFSNVELLTHEGNEELEHGFYRAEQISL